MKTSNPIAIRTRTYFIRIDSITHQTQQLQNGDLHAQIVKIQFSLSLKMVNI